MTGESPHQTGEPPRQGLLDTNVLVLRRWVDPTELPDEMAISAITLAELSAGPHQVRPNSEQDLYDEHEERARRTEALQRAESEFDPVPFDAEAARIYGRVNACPLRARPAATDDRPAQKKSPVEVMRSVRKQRRLGVPPARRAQRRSGFGAHAAAR
jgi:predicted nucleic acid-binding protein